MAFEYLVGYINSGTIMLNISSFISSIICERTLMSPRRPRGEGVNRPVKIQLETLLEQKAALPLFKNKADNVDISQIVT